MNKEEVLKENNIESALILRTTITLKMETLAHHTDSALNELKLIYDKYGVGGGTLETSAIKVDL